MAPPRDINSPASETLRPVVELPDPDVQVWRLVCALVTDKTPNAVLLRLPKGLYMKPDHQATWPKGYKRFNPNEVFHPVSETI